MEDTLKLVADLLLPIVVSIVLGLFAKHGTALLRIAFAYLEKISENPHIDKFIFQLEENIIGAYQTLIKQVKEEYKKNPNADLKALLEKAKREAKAQVRAISTKQLSEAGDVVKDFVGDSLDMLIESRLVQVKKRLKIAENPANPSGTSPQNPA